MKKCKLKVIGTNQTTKHLEDQVFCFSHFNFSARHNILQAELNNESYLLDIKSVTFDGDGVFIAAFISDEKKNVGRISLKYLS